jgi:hypothetical protein
MALVGIALTLCWLAGQVSAGNDAVVFAVVRSCHIVVFSCAALQLSCGWAGQKMVTTSGPFRHVEPQNIAPVPTTTHFYLTAYLGLSPPAWVLLHYFGCRMHLQATWCSDNSVMPVGGSLRANSCCCLFFTICLLTHFQNAGGDTFVDDELGITYESDQGDSGKCK